MRNHDFHRALGRRIGELRSLFEMSQTELAQQLGVSQQTVFIIELGDRRVSLDRVPVLLDVFGVSCEQLLGLRAIRPIPKARTSPSEQRHLERLRKPHHR